MHIIIIHATWSSWEETKVWTMAYSGLPYTVIEIQSDPNTYLKNCGHIGIRNQALPSNVILGLVQVAKAVT